MDEATRQRFQDKFTESTNLEKLSSILKIRKSVIEALVTLQLDEKLGVVDQDKKALLEDKLSKSNEVIIDILLVYPQAQQDDLLNQLSKL